MTRLVRRWLRICARNGAVGEDGSRAGRKRPIYDTRRPFEASSEGECGPEMFSRYVSSIRISTQTATLRRMGCPMTSLPSYETRPHVTACPA
jgi:hypothetical protein